MERPFIIPNYKKELRNEVKLFDQGYLTIIGGGITQDENGNSYLMEGIKLGSESFPHPGNSIPFPNKTLAQNLNPKPIVDADEISVFKNVSVLVTIVFVDSPIDRLSQYILFTQISREEETAKKSISFSRETD